MACISRIIPLRRIRRQRVQQRSDHDHRHHAGGRSAAVVGLELRRRLRGISVRNDLRCGGEPGYRRDARRRKHLAAGRSSPTFPKTTSAARTSSRSGATATGGSNYNGELVTLHGWDPGSANFLELNDAGAGEAGPWASNARCRRRRSAYYKLGCVRIKPGYSDYYGELQVYVDGRLLGATRASTERRPRVGLGRLLVHGHRQTRWRSASSRSRVCGRRKGAARTSTTCMSRRPHPNTAIRAHRSGSQYIETQLNDQDGSKVVGDDHQHPGRRRDLGWHVKLRGDRRQHQRRCL